MVRKQNSADCNSICLHASVIMIRIKRQGSVRKWLSLLIYEDLYKILYLEKQEWMLFR